MELNDSFSNNIGQIILMDPLPALNRVFSLFAKKEKEKQISIDNQNSNLMAFLT